MSCKGHCRHFKAHVIYFKGSPYQQGFMFCSGCGDACKAGIYIDPIKMRELFPNKTSGRCACCGQSLSIGSKHKTAATTPMVIARRR